MDIKELQNHGQSVWLDYFRRDLVSSGELARMVRDDGIRGITTNPTIFEQAITGTTYYDAAIELDVRRKDEPPGALYNRLVIDDIQQAADVLRPVYDATDGRDGFVSVEVSPYLAHDTRGSIEEARRLWREVGRDNLMIKIPGTREGLPAIQRLIGEGINVNVTLLFGREACRLVRDAYMAGLEMLVAHGASIDRVAGAASMFVSRVDVLVDNVLHDRIADATGDERVALNGLLGRVGIANAKLAYQDWKQAHASTRWRALAARGARPQRMLWASTSTKNPNLRDVLYVESLIGPDTIDTIPPKTLDAFRDHGEAADHLEEGLDGARDVMDALERAGISIDALADRLVEEGVGKFAAAFDQLFAALETKRAKVLSTALNRTSFALPEALDAEVAATLEAWRIAGNVRRLWARDPSLWTDRDESRWLGWLDIASHQRRSACDLGDLAEEVRARGFANAVLLGMGGSSLCADVLAKTLGSAPGFPVLHVLDSTVPAQILALQSRVSLRDTLFIVASKSGSTLEPKLLEAYFYQQARREIGDAGVGLHFIAVTDPGSPLARTAEAKRFGHLFLGAPDIGGRYSALSNFGMVPAALMGLDVPRLLDRAETMVHACAPYVPPRENPGVLLGAILGTLARSGRDKVTLVGSPGIEPLGAWIEQLLAESTGKQGKGLVPVDREALGSPDVYGDDRVFVYLRLDQAFEASQDAAVAALRESGQPVVRIAIADLLDIGQEFFRWQVAVAVAGSILGVDPFDQPDVEASKLATRSLFETYSATHALPPEAPFHREAEIALFADDRNRRELEQGAGNDRSLIGFLRAHVRRLQPRDYFAILAYVEDEVTHTDELQQIRIVVRNARQVATSLGFGPRFLHSTGQLHKGGPNTGVYLQITCDDARDVAVPDHGTSFGVVKAAEASGDLHVLDERGRRTLRVHLGLDVRAGLSTLRAAMERALSS
jgi:transaldolase / glucose-6-phosphate isomerase